MTENPLMLRNGLASTNPEDGIFFAEGRAHLEGGGGMTTEEEDDVVAPEDDIATEDEDAKLGGIGGNDDDIANGGAGGSDDDIATEDEDAKLGIGGDVLAHVCFDLCHGGTALCFGGVFGRGLLGGGRGGGTGGGASGALWATLNFNRVPSPIGELGNPSKFARAHDAI